MEHTPIDEIIDSATLKPVKKAGVRHGSVAWSKPCELLAGLRICGTNWVDAGDERSA